MINKCRLIIQQLFSWSVQTSDSGGIYSMPVLYFAILGILALIAYFGWHSYRQDVHEEKLQTVNAVNDESYSTFNLAWINHIINWVYGASPTGLPKAMERWMEDVNISLAKLDHPVKILLCSISEKTLPPWIGNVGKVVKKNEHIEIPVFLHAEEGDLVFTVSVQEENDGKEIASTYNLVATQFQCWFTLYLSRMEGQGFLAKLVAKSQPSRKVKFRLELVSNQKISTTVPEVVKDMAVKSILDTPFYLNVSDWGPILPTSAKNSRSSNRRLRKEQSLAASHHSDEEEELANGQNDRNAVKLRKRTKSKKEKASPKKSTADEQDGLKSNTLPTSTAVSERLKANGSHGLSGSLGSLVGIKRSPSGRGPAKPIRSREIRIVMKVIETAGLPKGGPVFCRGILDQPQQKSETRPCETSSNPAWPDDELTFDLSSRSSEVKLVLYQSDGAGEGCAVASAILYLEKIGTDKSTKLVLPLRTVNKESAQVTLQLDFTENPVDPTSQKFSSPRRSLDLSYMSDETFGKEPARSMSMVSTPSSYFSENMSTSRKTGTQTTTVKTVTTKKLTKSTNVTSTPPNSKQTDIESDTATVEGSVVETVVKDLSEKAELSKRSPDSSAKIRRAKTYLDENGDGEDILTVETTGEECTAQRSESFHSVNQSEAGAQAQALSNGSGESVRSLEGSAGKNGSSQGSSKTRKKRDQRPKSLAAGIKSSDMPRQDQDTEWPKMRRSRSLVFGRGKKKHQKTGSVTDLDKQTNSKGESGFDDDSMLTVPENDLQKSNKKKKSRSISKLMSKLGRRPSQRKSKVLADRADEEDSAASISGSLSSPNSFAASPGFQSPSGRPESLAESEDQSFDLGSTSRNSSALDSAGIKRSKSLRKRLFGGKRKTSKN